MLKQRKEGSRRGGAKVSEIEGGKQKEKGKDKEKKGKKK